MKRHMEDMPVREDGLPYKNQVYICLNCEFSIKVTHDCALEDPELNSIILQCCDEPMTLKEKK